MLELLGDIGMEPHVTGIPASGCPFPMLLLPKELLEVLQLGNSPVDTSTFNSAGCRVSDPHWRGQTRYIDYCPSKPAEFPLPEETTAALALKCALCLCSVAAHGFLSLRPLVPGLGCPGSGLCHWFSLAPLLAELLPLRLCF